MLLIACPFCGPRDETEFRCGGESHIIRPGPAPEVS
ncbi:MAG: sarcosine oxidase subunit delta, partial [Alphaproteobacteria bacterium]